MKDKNPKVLIVCKSYLPGVKSGGPIRSLSNIIERFGSEIDFHVITNDRDSGDQFPYPDISMDKWQSVGMAQVLYQESSRLTLSRYTNVFRELDFDCLYLNSLFSRRHTIFPLLAMRRMGLTAKVVLAPRGELSPGALSLRSFRKTMFLSISKRVQLFRSVHWHATNEIEQYEIRKRFHADAVVLPNLIENRPIAAPKPLGKRLRIALLGRVAPMKNIPFAIRAVLKAGVDAEFNIFGPTEDNATVLRCKALINSSPRNVEIRFRGVIKNSDVLNVLRQHDLFLLPTLGENFGHAIWEALSAGCILLLSDQTPWRALESKGVGWDLPLENLDRFASCISEIANLSIEERLARRRHSIKYAKEFLAINRQSTAAYRDLLRCQG